MGRADRRTGEVPSTAAGGGAGDVWPSLTLRRHIKAPPERVFAAWTEPAYLIRWFCPPGTETDIVEIDPKPGGRYRIGMRERNGEVHQVAGVYLEFDPPLRLVFTWAWVSTPDRESVVTVDIVPHDGGSDLVLTHAQFADEEARDRHGGVWQRTLDVLVAVLQQMPFNQGKQP